MVFCCFKDNLRELEMILNWIEDTDVVFDVSNDWVAKAPDPLDPCLGKS